jgi:O-antigen/teichoic acid export membrane protein
MRAITFLQNKKTLVLMDQAVFSGSNFVATTLLARLLPASDFGIYSGFILVLYLMVSLSNALVIQPFQVLYPHYREDKAYLNFTFVFQLLVSLLICGSIGLLAQANSVPIKEYWLPSLLVAFGFLLHDFLRKMFLAQDRIIPALIIDIVTGVVQVLILAGSFFYYVLSLRYALSLTAISFLLGALVGIAILRPQVSVTISWTVFFISHIRHGKWLSLTAVMQWWSGNFFVVAAGVVLGPVALGAFRLVQSLFGILNVLLQTYENYVLPQAVRIFSESVSESKKYLREISLKGLFLLGSVLTLLFIFSKQIIVLAGGSQYAEYSYVVKGMSLLYFIIFVGYPVRIAVRMMVLNHIFFLGYVLSFCFSALSFSFLLKQYDLWGAIIGLIINQCILILFWQYHLSKRQFILWK